MDLMPRNAGVSKLRPKVDSPSGMFWAAGQGVCHRTLTSVATVSREKRETVEVNDYPPCCRYADHSSTVLMSSIGTAQVTLNATREEDRSLKLSEV